MSHEEGAATQGGAAHIQDEPILKYAIELEFGSEFSASRDRYYRLLGSMVESLKKVVSYFDLSLGADIGPAPWRVTLIPNGLIHFEEYEKNVRHMIDTLMEYSDLKLRSNSRSAPYAPLVSREEVDRANLLDKLPALEAWRKILRAVRRKGPHRDILIFCGAELYEAIPVPGSGQLRENKENPAVTY